MRQIERRWARLLLQPWGQARMLPILFVAGFVILTVVVLLLPNNRSVRADDTSFLSCTANAAVTTNSGDNNGFQLNPGNACANDAAFAEDTNGGTANSTSCSSTARDRHLFFNYGFGVPASSTINGIEVRLDAWADSI